MPCFRGSVRACYGPLAVHRVHRLGLSLIAVAVNVAVNLREHAVLVPTKRHQPGVSELHQRPARRLSPTGGAVIATPPTIARSMPWSLGLHTWRGSCPVNIEDVRPNHAQLVWLVATKAGEHAEHYGHTTDRA